MAPTPTTNQVAQGEVDLPEATINAATSSLGDHAKDNPNPERALTISITSPSHVLT